MSHPLLKLFCLLVDEGRTKSRECFVLVGDRKGTDTQKFAPFSP